MEKQRERIEELLKFTLESHINQTLEFNLGLSKDFCINLLEEDPNDMLCHSTPTPTPTDSFDGVALYPLYKRLASALYRSVKSGAVCRTYEKMVFGDKDSNLKQKEENWDQLIKEKGLELINVLEGISCEIHVQEPYFSLLKDGRKTIEGRCATGDYIRIEPGDLILVNKIVVLKVEDVRRYASFSKMLQAENLEKVLPGVKTVEEGVKIYRKFYTEEKEMSNGVLAICVSKLAAQPYLSLASILFIKGSALTHGARALAKHAERSRDRYWGILGGSDSTKNRLAMNVISRIIASCCWSNIHVVPQHGAVFEIRVADGYGARWSKDGTKFIGFLEPYIEDGHSRGWKH
uniref:ASCH domain-containing protein n=1 Tax=Populus trichocarpa TaxID=3694 RepID=A0A3N7F7W0_POPTR